MGTGMKKALAILTLTASLNASQIITDSQLGYTINLPDHWVREAVDTNHHQFYDTTATYQAIVTIVRFDIGKDNLFSSAEEWTRANFIAYKLMVESDPFDNLVFYDTISVRQNDTLWATEAYAQYFSYDSSMDDLAEYIRFSGCGPYGYELSVIGANADLDTNIAIYATIIEGIILPPGKVAVLRPHTVVRPAHSTLPAMYRPVDLLGRNLMGRCRTKTSQIIIDKTGVFRVVR
jgi:hypothetical protein